MKNIILVITYTLILSACANTHVGVNANNNGVFGAIGQSYRW